MKFCNVVVQTLFNILHMKIDMVDEIHDLPLQILIEEKCFNMFKK